MTDQAYINRIIGSVYTDLGYLVDVGAITDEDYEEITKRIPRRFRGQPKIEPVPDVGNLSIGAGPSSDAGRRQVPSAPTAATTTSSPAPVSMAQAMRMNNSGRQTPQPQPPAPPAQTPQLIGIGQAEALYDYHSGDPGDLDFKRGEHVTILEYANADWWRGSNSAGREGIFPSNYVKKTSDQGRPAFSIPPVSQQQASQYPTVPQDQYNPQDYRPVQYAPQQGPGQGAITVVENKKTGKLGKLGGRLGDAAVTGAGFAVGASIVNAIL